MRDGINTTYTSVSGESEQLRCRIRDLKYIRERVWSREWSHGHPSEVLNIQHITSTGLESDDTCNYRFWIHQNWPTIVGLDVSRLTYNYRCWCITLPASSGFQSGFYSSMTPVNSITSRTQMTNVYSFLPTWSRVLVWTNAVLCYSILKLWGRLFIDLIEGWPIIVLDLGRRDFCSGSLSYYCRLDSRCWLVAIASVGVDWQEGGFFSSFCWRIFTDKARFYQAKSTDQLMEATLGLLLTWLQVPWSIIGISGIAYQWIASRVETYLFRSRRSGYRDVPMLRFFELRMKRLGEGVIFNLEMWISFSGHSCFCIYIC